MGASLPFSLRSLVSATFFFHLATSATDPNIEFIQTNCALTLYPNRCFHSLSPFSDKINQNPALLARVAITVSLSWANHFSAHLDTISDHASTSGMTNVSEALDDCVSEFADAVDQIGSSLQQMEQLSSGGERLRFDLSNVQTWMSSAITNEDTCMVGFKGVRDGDTKRDVVTRVAEVKEVTSNALSLVNSYVSKIN